MCQTVVSSSKNQNAYETVALFRSGASAGAKQVAALARLGSEATPLVALRTAVDFGEFLAILGPFAPAAGLARLVTSRTLTLRLREIVNVENLGIGARDDLLPVDRLHVAQVVVVEQSATTRQYICNIIKFRIKLQISSFYEKKFKLNELKLILIQLNLS